MVGLFLAMILVATICFILFMTTQQRWYLYVALGIGLVAFIIVAFEGFNLGGTLVPKPTDTPDVFGTQ